MFSCPTFKKVEFIDLLVNASYYAHLLNVYGAVGFKKINVTPAQQQELCRRLGDFVNWIPNSKFPTPSVEQYVQTLELELQSKKPRQKFLTELTMDITSQPASVGSILNNTVFQCNKKSGSTVLIDMRKVFNLLGAERKEVVNKIVWLDSETGISRLMVENHRNTNQKILIFSTEFSSGLDKDSRYRFFLDGDEVNQEQKKILKEIFDEILDIIHICNLNILEEWKWDEKDLLIIDDSCMMQATKGAFKYGSRIMIHQKCTAN
jgi:hypothetical protein